MNTWPGPENSWEGVDAYFTWASSPGMLVVLTLVVCAICIGIVVSAAKHESETEQKTK